LGWDRSGFNFEAAFSVHTRALTATRIGRLRAIAVLVTLAERILYSTVRDRPCIPLGIAYRIRSAEVFLARTGRTRSTRTARDHKRIARTTALAFNTGRLRKTLNLQTAVVIIAIAILAQLIEVITVTAMKDRSGEAGENRQTSHGCPLLTLSAIGTNQRRCAF
jgi:hypothetical protein